MIDSLEMNGYITSVNTSSNITFYNITKKGIDAYEKWIKDFLNFARRKISPILLLIQRDLRLPIMSL